MSERAPIGNCPQCGTPAHIGCEHSRQSQEAGSHPEFSKELLPRMSNLEFEVRADFGATLERLRERTGADLQPRPEGYHVTIIGPTESGKLKELVDEDVAELMAINEAIKAGEGVQIKGIGYIDGANSQFNLRGADLEKKTAFVALDIPRLAAFREKIGLPPKDFHVTLGFVGGDIHMQVTGQEEIKPGKFKDVKGPVPKQADPTFADITLPELTFGGLGGPLKQEKQEKPAAAPQPEKKEKKAAAYNPEKLRQLLVDLVASGNCGGITAERIDKIVEIATTDASKLGQELRGDFRFVRPLLEQAEEK